MHIRMQIHIHIQRELQREELNKFISSRICKLLTIMKLCGYIQYLLFFIHFNKRFTLATILIRFAFVLPIRKVSEPIEA